MSPIWDTYNTITIYRNAGFQFPILLENSALYPQIVTGYGFALIIAKSVSPTSNSLGAIAISKSNPTAVEPGLVTFQLTPGDTSLLLANLAYTYVVMAQPTGQLPLVYQTGRVKVVDSPQMPTFTPVA